MERSRASRGAVLERKRRAIRVRLARYEIDDWLTRYQRDQAEKGAREARLHRYVELPARAISGAARALVERAVAAAVRELGIPAPSLHYYRELAPAEVASEKASVQDLAGFTHDASVRGKADARRNEVWLRADPDATDLVETAAHECRHLAQRTDDEQGDEEQATRYGVAFLFAFAMREHAARAHADRMLLEAAA